jgi:hypothetical protein
MTYRKSISYCYPTSTNAEILGQAGFYVEMSTLNEAGEWSPGYIHQGHDVFNYTTDPELLSLFNEIDAQVSPYCISLSDFL